MLLLLLSCAPSPPEPTPVGPRAARLTHTQWDNAAQQLLALSEPTGLSPGFLGDTLSEGFDNNAERLLVDPLLFQDYQRAAERLALELRQDGPRYGLVVPQDPREGGGAGDFSWRVQAEDAQANAGGAYGGIYNLWSNGELWADVELPIEGLYQLRAQVEGSDCGDGVGALASLRVDGQALLEREVLGADTLEVDVRLGQGEHRVSVAFLNDCVDGDHDRNLIIEWLEVEGGAALGQSHAGRAEAALWIRDIGRQAYRRPLTGVELSTYLGLFERGPELLGTGDDFADGVQLVLTALLQAPRFLYRLEEGAAGQPLSDHELAARLSFSLWQAPPDSTLSAMADAGALTRAGQLSAHSVRMLNDPKALAGLLDLHGQLLEIDNYDTITKLDGAWSAELNSWMRQETEGFVAAVVFEDDGGLRELLTADFTVANAQVAALYGAEGGEGFERVALDPSQRAGLLTLSGFLAMQADSRQSSPIHRGVFINEVLLCAELPPPPDDVTGLPAQAEGLTNRERVEAHTGDGTCGQGCHSSLINPPGFALEQYDELGRFRDTDNGRSVDASGSYPFADGVQAWTDGVGFIHLLAESPQVHRCYVQHLMQYSYGRAVLEGDRADLDRLAQASLEGASVKQLLLELVQLPGFTHRGRP